MTEYYVYAYLREDCTPYYVGKGKNSRAFTHHKHESVRTPNDKSKITFLKENLNEDDAFMWEVFYIAEYGRKDLGTGLLRNKTDGGEGATGADRKGSKNSFYGKTHSEYTKNLISEKNKGRVPHTAFKEGHESWNKGKNLGPLSEETKKKISEKLKGVNVGIVRDELFKMKVSESHKHRIKYICEHCGKENLNTVNYKRWHGLNCKVKNEK